MVSASHNGQTAGGVAHKAVAVAIVDARITKSVEVGVARVL
ncbi:Uncharacterised protein [Mycobacteroides abscessus subsp. abscessus]|nr:Uncharacterised protein [Mycobacteroides abscessus subsp. abscessus]